MIQQTLPVSISLATLAKSRLRSKNENEARSRLRILPLYLSPELSAKCGNKFCPKPADIIRAETVGKSDPSIRYFKTQVILLFCWGNDKSHFTEAAGISIFHGVGDQFVGEKSERYGLVS